MRKIYTSLFILFCFVTLQAQTFEFSLVYVGVNSSTNNHQVAFMATPSAPVTNGVTADMGGGFYVPTGLVIANFIQGNSGLPASEFVSLPLGSNGNGDAFFVARIESGGSSVILNGAGPFQLILFDIIADPNPTSGQIIFVENGDPVFDSLFVENYININLGSGTVNAYSQNNPIANSIDFSTLGNKAFELAQVSIYPNPASNYITIGYPLEIKKVELFNLLGKLVLQEQEFKTINISNLSDGIYIMKVHTIEGVVSKKIIKK